MCDTEPGDYSQGFIFDFNMFDPAPRGGAHVRRDGAHGRSFGVHRPWSIAFPAVGCDQP